MEIQCKTPALYVLLALFPLLFISCIGDDIIDDEVDPVLRITNAIDTLAFDSTYQFELMYLNNIGREEPANNVSWTSSAPDIISIASTGLAQGLQSGQAFLKAEVQVDGAAVSDEILVHVGEETIIATTERSGTIATTSSYALEGDFTLFEDAGTLKLAFAENYRASSALPGLYIYLTNNPNTSAGAHEIGEVTTFSGAHTYTLADGVGLNDYEYVLYFCKPFNVKVGDGKIEN